MSAWKELQLALNSKSTTEAEIEEGERAWADECRREGAFDGQADTGCRENA